MSEVYAIFATIGEHIPFKKKEKIGEANSEGSINLLHYRATVLIIISFCLLVTSVDLIAGNFNYHNVNARFCHHNVINNVKRLFTDYEINYPI